MSSPDVQVEIVINGKPVIGSRNISTYDDTSGSAKADEQIILLKSTTSGSSMEPEDKEEYPSDQGLEQVATKQDIESKSELFLKDLVNELQEVIDWFYLGMCLDVPIPTLLTIKRDLRNTDECRTRMLEAWMNQEEEPTWSKIVAALREMKKTALAEQIGSKFDVASAPEPETKVKPGDRSVVPLNMSYTDSSQELPEANLKDLVSELHEVTDWFHLGICLGILLAMLQSIKRDYRHIDEHRREVLLAWMNNEKPTWSKLVDALVDMRNMSLAYQIAGKYDVPISTTDYVIEENQQDESETAMLQPGGRKPSLKDLLRELQQVIEWKHLGQLLGLSESDLEAIYEENEITEDCRREMLLFWMERDPNCSWKKITDALIEMKAETLAAQIASRYDVPILQSVKDLAKAEAPQELDVPIPQSVKDLARAEAPQEGIPCPVELQTQMVEVAMRDLLSELQEFTNWFYFGVCLGVHQSTLKEIRQDYKDTEECKREMLAVWRNKEIATWSKVIRALAEVGMPRLALEIASKYGENVPPSLKEAVDNLEHDIAEAQKLGATKREVNSGVGQPEEERIIPEYEEKGEVKLKDLVNELQEVTDWFALGVYLGLEMSTLASVRTDCMGTNECRRSMLGIWMREQEATWSKVVHALVQMKMYHLAVQIASKYSAPIAKSAVKAMRGKIPEGELKILEVVQGEEDTDSESSSDEEGDEAEMRDLIQELEEVTEWDYLGVCLGVPGSTLRAIRRDERGAEGRKRAMLIEWAKIKKPTWYRVVRALLEMGREVLAKRIAEKYDIPVPKNIRRRRHPEQLQVEEEEEHEAPLSMAPPVPAQIPPSMPPPMPAPMPPPMQIQVQMAANIPRPDYPGPHSFLVLAVIVTCIGALLNFPSFLCGITATAFALRSKGLSNAGYYARAKRYANTALFCIMYDIIYTLGVAVLAIGLIFGLYQYYFGGYA